MLEVIAMPGVVGEVSESADAPVALAEYSLPTTQGISKCEMGEVLTVPSPWTQRTRPSV